MTTENAALAVQTSLAKPSLAGLEQINTSGSGGGFMPALKTLAEVMQWCDMASRSNMVPKAYRDKPFDIMVAMQFGAEIGLKWLQSLQSIAVVNGTPSLFGDAVLALVRSSGLLEDFDEWIEVNGVRQTGSFPIISYAEDETKTIVAYCLSKRKGMPHARTTTFSVDDAKRAKLWLKVGMSGAETPWCTVPARMLMWRARGWNLRDNFGDVLKGMAIYEELADIDHVTPASITSTIAQASQVQTKGIEVLGKLAAVVQERGVEPPALQAQSAPVRSEPVVVAQEAQESPATAPGVNQDAQDTDTTPSAEPVAQVNEEDAHEAMLNAIATAEFGLKNTDAGKKKYHAVLGVMKVKLSGKQEPAQVLPKEQLGFYLAQLQKALAAMKATA